MGIPYTIKSGDTLSKLAKQFGYTSWKDIYHHPDNAPFRARRPNPDKIFPGDQLILPDRFELLVPPACVFARGNTSLLSAPKTTLKVTQGTSDDTIMRKAFQDSRSTLGIARQALINLQAGFAREKSGIPLSAFEQRVLISVGRWLKADTKAAARAVTAAVVAKAISLMGANLGVRTSAGTDPTFRRVDVAVHAFVTGDPEAGVNCGTDFFTSDGPNCRRDVVTHEFFHFLGVHHGGGAADAPTPRAQITASTQALDSADNLAQLVSEIINGRTDACAAVGV